MSPTVPDYPYRYIPATSAARSFEQRLGTYTIVPREGLVAEIVGGPGVTEPW